MRTSLHKIVFLLLTLLAVPMFITADADADEVEDAITEALQSYKDGDFTAAAGSLEYAAQLIRQQKGGQLEVFLPQPLSGWTAADASSQAMGAAMLGGGVTAQRSYTKGDGNITIQIITDSPMMQGMMMLFSNPMFAASDGGKLEKIKGQKAIVKYKAADKQGDVNIMVANRFLVMVEGSGVSKQDLKAYAGAVDYKKLATLP